MAKQPKDTETIELTLPKRRGRPAQYGSKAERQAAYRQRMLITRSKEIEALRACQSELHALQQELQARESAAIESETAEKKSNLSEKDVHKLRDIEGRLDHMKSELALWKFKKASRIRELLEKKVIMPKRDLAAVFMVDYAGTPIETGYEFERATKKALEFGRRAASAGSAISEIAGTLSRKGQISHDEYAILSAAGKILGDIHSKATFIKESAKRNASAVKAAEAAREKAATIAIGKSFPDIAPIQMTCFLGQRHWEHEKLREMRPEKVDPFDIGYYVEVLEKSLRSDLRNRVISAIVQGHKADDAATALRAEYLAKLPEIEATHKTEIENLKACQVAAALIRANEKSSK